MRPVVVACAVRWGEPATRTGPSATGTARRAGRVSGVLTVPTSYAAVGSTEGTVVQALPRVAGGGPEALEAGVAALEVLVMKRMVRAVKSPPASSSLRSPWGLWVGGRLSRRRRAARGRRCSRRRCCARAHGG